MLASAPRLAQKQESESFWISKGHERENGVAAKDARKRHCSFGAGVCAAAAGVAIPVDDSDSIVFSSDTSDPEEGGGMGAVVVTGRVGTVYMTPRTFLALATPLNTSKTEAKEKMGRIMAGLHANYAMGTPTLWLEQTDTAGLFAVGMHEGRHRMAVVVDVLGPDCLIPVQLGGPAGVKLPDITALRNESGTSVLSFADIAVVPVRPLGAYHKVRVSSKKTPQIL